MDIEDLIAAEELVGLEELVGADDSLESLLDLVAGEDADMVDMMLGEHLEDPDEVGARGRKRALLRRLLGSRARRLRGATRGSGTKAVVRALMAQKVAQQAALKGAARAIPASANKSRVLMIGGEATAAAAGLLNISTTVQQLARVDRLFISATDAGGGVRPPASYRVSDIKVGTVSQFAALPSLPGIMFTEDATGQGYALGLDTVQPGTDFTVQIANAAAGDIFNFGAYATALR